MVTPKIVLLWTIASLACVVSSTSVGSRNINDVIKGTELVFAFMTHRHGDRTPIPFTLSFIDEILNKTEAETLINKYGYGQLTDAGKRSGYKTGQFIRRRYKDFIAPKYNKSEIYIRSTDSERAKKTVLAAMSAVYPVGKDNWSEEINWDPVPYTTVPMKDDYNLFFVNCPKYINYFHNLVYTTDEKRMRSYAAFINVVSKEIGHDISEAPLTILFVYDVLKSLDSMGYKIPENVRQLMPDMEEAAAHALDIITAGEESMVPLQSGPLLNEFFKHANAVIARNETQRVRIYSAHDFNVLSFKVATRVKRMGVPKYASLYSLELRKVVRTGQYVVLPVYLSDPHEGVEKYLQVEGCDLLCDYDSFYRITSGYLRDGESWRKECGAFKESDINLSLID